LEFEGVIFMAIKKYGKVFLFSTTFLLAGLQLGKWVNKDTGFRVQKEVLTAAKAPMNKSIFDVEFAAITKRVETLPFVERVQVSRIFPSTLVIAVQERRPLALINNAGLWPIDEYGVVLPQLQAGRRMNDPASFDTPVLSGIALAKDKERKQLPAAAKPLLDFLTELRTSNPMLYHSISELNLNAKGNLTFYLMQGGVPVYLGPDSWMEKSERLFIFLQHVQTTSGKLAAIDLRYANQIVTRES
jgi:cell division septal protein FtsQ